MPDDKLPPARQQRLARNARRRTNLPPPLFVLRCIVLLTRHRPGIVINSSNAFESYHY